MFMINHTPLRDATTKVLIRAEDNDQSCKAYKDSKKAFQNSDQYMYNNYNNSVSASVY